MVQRLSCEEVLLSTLTEPSLMKSRVAEGVFDVSRHPLAKDTNSAKESNHRAGDGCHDQEEHHHGDGPILILVIKGRTKETVSSDGFGKTSSFLKRWRLPSRDALALSDFATHAATSRMRVIALAKVGMPQPSFTDANIS